MAKQTGAGTGGALAPGSRLHERYRILRTLGQGGFSVTYLAYDEELAVNAALKECFPQQLAAREADGKTVFVPVEQQETFEKMKVFFKKEAEFTFGSYDQTGICAVKDFFEANGTVYIAEEYLPGGTLKDYLGSCPEKRISFEKARDMFQPVLKGLAFLHERGSIHGDLSPDNLMFDGEGRMKMVDFGSSWLFASEKKDYRTFKPCYAAPEQYVKDGTVGPWTDIYGICAVFYEALTGKKPAAMEERLKGRQIKPIRERADIAPEAEHAILQGMQPDIPKRYFYIGTLMERLGIDTREIRPYLPKTRERWGEAWMHAATQESTLFAKKRQLLSRRQKQLLRRTAIVLGGCAGIFAAGVLSFARLNPRAVLQLRLRQKRVQAQQEVQTACVPDEELLESLELYKTGEYDSLTTYASIPEEWFKEQGIFGNQETLFAADRSLLEDAAKEAYGQAFTEEAVEFDGTVNYYPDEEALSVLCEKTGSYELKKEDASQVRMEAVYDICENRILHVSVQGSEQDISVFLQEVFPYLAAGKYLTEEEIGELLQKAAEVPGEDAKAAAPENYYLALSCAEDEEDVYSLELSKAQSALYGVFGGYDYKF